MSETIAVIGGGPAGLEAARGVADLGGTVVLIEKENFLGGTPIRENYANLTPHMEPAEVAMGRMIDGVPPRKLSFSMSTTVPPRSATPRAASRPAGPPPMTAMVSDISPPFPSPGDTAGVSRRRPR